MREMDAISQQKIWIVIPVFNRKATTLGCLLHLEKLGIFDWAEVIVADGGSSDGTPEAIRADFKRVHLLEGKWWWMEGIRAGMEYAQQQEAKIYVWLNDDCRPREGSMEALVQHTRQTSSISGGITYSEDGGTYMGAVKTSQGLQSFTPKNLENVETLQADALVGNFVAIPEACVAKIGLPDAKMFPHLYGDYYYTFEASRAGFACFLIKAAAADDVHPLTNDRMSILRGDQPLKVIWRQLTQWNPHHGLLPEWRFYQRFWNGKGQVIVLKPWFKNWILFALRILMPSWIRKRL